MESKIIKFRTDRVILMGDTHSEVITKKLLNRVPDGSDVFHVGDVGIGFGDPVYSLGNVKGWINVLNDECKKHDLLLYLNRGNHDCPVCWKKDYGKENVVFVNTGDSGIFPNGKTVLFIGGGVSVDRYIRTEKIDWWRDEVTEPIDIDRSYDIMFAHDAPEQFNHPTTSLNQYWSWYVEMDRLLV